MSKLAKKLIEEEIRKLKTKLRRLDYERDRVLIKIEDLEKSIKEND